MYFSSCIDSCYKNLNSCQSHIHYFFIYFSIQFWVPCACMHTTTTSSRFPSCTKLSAKKASPSLLPCQGTGCFGGNRKTGKDFPPHVSQGTTPFLQITFQLHRNPITVQFIPPTIFFPFYHQHHYCLLWFHLLPCCRCLRRRCTCHPNRRRHRRPVSIV